MRNIMIIIKKQLKDTIKNILTMLKISAPEAM